jgi:hypothetical protein
VVCPICQQAALVQHRGVILCPNQDRGCLRLDVAAERLSLDQLREQLSGTLEVGQSLS